MYIATEKNYGPGSLLTFDAEAPGKATALTVDITPVQSGSGDPSPSNVRPISGWGEVNVCVAGKNILNPNMLPSRTQYTVNADGTITVTGGDSTAWTTIDPVPLPAGTYTVHVEGQDGYSQVRTSEDGYATNFSVPKTFTLSQAGGVKFKFNLGGNATYPKTIKVQVEAGSSATDYEPYTGTSVTVDLDGTRYGGVLDMVTGVLTVDRVKIDFAPNAISTWFDNDINRNTLGFYLAAADFDSRYTEPGIGQASGTVGVGMFEQYKKASAYGNDNPYVAQLLFINGSFSRFEARVPKSELGAFSTYAESKTAVTNYLASNPISMCYEIATPLVVQLSPETVSTLAGTNNVWADAGGVSIRLVEYAQEGGTPDEAYRSYLEALRGDFTKLAKLEFLNPGGDVAFALDNNPLNKRSGAFIQSGTISCNLQNGRRRQASVTLHNLDHAYEFAVNHIWFGQQIRLSEGLILPDGTEYYIPQGVFEIETPAEALKPGQRTVTYNLVDKWANLDGTHFGNLEDVYSVVADTNILAAIAALLKLDRYTAENNGANPIDPVAPLFTEYYNDKTQTLTDGTVVSLIQAPYDFLSASTGTYADVVLGLVEMIAGDVGYNQTGRLVVNPSQDDIADQNKPILWEFTENDKAFLGADYSPKPADVYNDVIVVGATSDENVTARGRAQNNDPASDTCISRIGRKTIRLEMPNYYSDTICQDYAMWQLKRYSTMSKSVTVTCTQMFHIVENQLITVQRSDKPGSPIERHVVQGFSRPIGQTGTMTINCISTEDYPNATLVESDLS